MHPISFIHSKTNAHTHTLTQLIDKTKQSNHLEQMQNIIYPPNANYLILCTRTHTHTSNTCLYMTVCHSLSQKKILFWFAEYFIHILQKKKKKIIDVMVHIGDHKNQSQWVFVFSRIMKNSLIEFNGIR